MKNKRCIGVLVMLPLLLLLILGGDILNYSVLIFSLIGINEFYQSLENKKIKPLKFFGFFMCCVYELFIINSININYFLLVFITTVIILMCYIVMFNKQNIIDISSTIFGFIYVSVLFSFIILLNNTPNGHYLIWIIFICAWACDSTAYFVGRLLGKHKLCPNVSPNKTIEGSIGGLCGSIIICLIFGLIMKYNHIDLNLSTGTLFIIGLINGFLCQFGDLFASSIKRYAGIKDFSNLIPGHGGILDRFDSVLFSGFGTYLIITIITRLL